MLKPQEKQAFNASNTTPIIMEYEQEGSHISDNYYHHQDAFFSSRCGCFRLFCCFGYQRHQDGETTGLLHHQQQQSRDLLEKDVWLMRKLKILKEFSELVAGPKWKNLIRKFSKKPRWRKKTAGNTAVFQYDPRSYALNFNDQAQDDDLLPRSFSTRFAPPPSRSVVGAN